jgi:competence protein ComEC
MSSDAPGALPADAAPPAGGELLIYWIDTEGGASTVIRAPNGQIMVVDTGFPGDRDGTRVMSVLRNELKATKVDYLITTHYDPDHTGGIGIVAREIDVAQFIDYGGTLPAIIRSAVGNKPRRIIKPGEIIDLGDTRFAFVSSGKQLVEQPLPMAAPAAPNPLCQGAEVKQGDDENANGVGFVMSRGNFDFVALGDLLWRWEHDLACPVNRLGKVEIYQTTHHGQAQSGAPQLVHAMEPLVAVMNNGANKGGAPPSFVTLKSSPGLQDLWQLHRSNSAGSGNAADDTIANADGPDRGLWLKATVDATGRITMFNPRNQHTRSYQSR